MSIATTTTTTTYSATYKTDNAAAPFATFEEAETAAIEYLRTATVKWDHPLAPVGAMDVLPKYETILKSVSAEGMDDEGLTEEEKNEIARMMWDIEAQYMLVLPANLEVGAIPSSFNAGEIVRESKAHNPNGERYVVVGRRDDDLMRQEITRAKKAATL